MAKKEGEIYLIFNGLIKRKFLLSLTVGGKNLIWKLKQPTGGDLIIVPPKTAISEYQLSVFRILMIVFKQGS